MIFCLSSLWIDASISLCCVFRVCVWVNIIIVCTVKYVFPSLYTILEMKCVDRQNFERNKQKIGFCCCFFFFLQNHINFVSEYCILQLLRRIHIWLLLIFIIFFVSIPSQSITNVGNFPLVFSSMVYIILVDSNYILTTRSHFKTHLHIHKMPENCIRVLSKNWSEK